MKPVWIILGILLFLLLVGLSVSYIGFRLACYAPKKQREKTAAALCPPGDVYEPFLPQMKTWIAQAEQFSKTRYTITSFDGLTLCADYYEYQKGAPVELMFHGYRGSVRRDLSGGIHRCFAVGHNVLAVHQRSSAESEGKVITFGIKEHKDCLDWIDFLIGLQGADVKIMLTGISMGAATVLMASDQDLPENVVGILADCGYTSPKAIIKKVIKDLKLPPNLLYPFVRLGARLFGKVDLESHAPLQAVANSKVPILFVHGDTDAFVPYNMSRQLYDACKGEKRFLTVKGAGHGLSFAVDAKGYYDTLLEFCALCGIPTQLQE